MVEPTPGRISGVGGLGVAAAPSVGVTEGGNQTMVGVRVGVSVVSVGIGVALRASKTAQELVSMATSAGIKIRKNIM
jgi:hypothetical protein